MNANETKTAETKYSKKNFAIGRLVSAIRGDNSRLMQDCQMIDRAVIQMICDIGGYGMFPTYEAGNDEVRKTAFNAIAERLEDMAQSCEALAKIVRSRNSEIDAMED